jgi:MtN3 and saliva related transmembrane protein
MNCELGSASLLSETIGTVAAILTTLAFVPQAIRTWRVGAEGLSWMMLACFGTGVGLWFIYGLMRSSGPLILANGITCVQVLFILAIKFWRRGRSPNATDHRGKLARNPPRHTRPEGSLSGPR